MEKNYDFKEELLCVHKKDRRDLSLLPDKDEYEIKNGFCISIYEGAGDIAMTAAFDFADYLLVSMNVGAMVTHEACEKALVISLNSDIEEASGYMGYRINVTKDKITLEGYDERGIAQGLYHLEDVMNIRKAPFLKFGITKRKSLMRVRTTQSPLGMFEYPDSALSMIAHYGMNVIAVWIKDAYTNNRGDFIDLNLLCKRAHKYGIDIAASLYCPHSKHPDDEGAQEYYDKLYGDLFSACPDIKYITVVGEAAQFSSRDPRAGKAPKVNNFVENIPTGKPSPGWWPCSDYPEWIKMVKKSVDKYSNGAKIIFSTYNWGWAPKEDRLKIISELPDGLIVLPTWDMFHQYRVGDVVENIVDYSLAFAGPGEYFISEAEEVSKREDLLLFANAQSSGRTWDFGVVPYEPMPGQWIKKYEKMVEAHYKWGLSGVEENIHYGFYPSFIMDIEKEAFFSNSRPLGEFADDIFARDFDEYADKAKEACKRFDEAIEHYVPTNEDQYGAFRIGPSYPLYFEPVRAPEGGKYPNRNHAMFGNGVYYSVYTPLIKARSSLTGVRLAEEIKQNEIMAEYFLEGIKILETCENANKNLQRLLNLAKFMYRTTLTVINVKHHYILKQRFSIAKSYDEANDILDSTEKLLREERQNVLETIPLVEFDSRLGWEPSMEYTTDRRGLEWKIRQLDYELGSVMPKLRQSNELIKRF